MSTSMLYEYGDIYESGYLHEYCYIDCRWRENSMYLVAVLQVAIGLYKYKSKAYCPSDVMKNAFQLCSCRCARS